MSKSSTKSIILASANECTGCSACAAVCPQHCISMQYDREGFLQPVIDKNCCVECHKCEKTCPVIIRKIGKWIVPGNCVQEGFAAYNDNTEERLNSSSGGIAALFSHSVIKQGGVVVGVGFDSKWMPSYMFIEEECDIPKIQGSKYAQAKIDIDIFYKIKEFLIAGRLVMFIGLACQIEGLRSYLNNDFENLLLVDLICLGISSPMVWNDYLKVVSEKNSIKHINFKDKRLGWHQFSVVIETNNGCQALTGDKDMFMQSFFRTISLRKSCLKCSRRTIERVADITLADCWGAYKIVPEMDDNKGLSAVVIHSRKGQLFWNGINSISKQIPLSEIVDGNPNMVKNFTPDYKNRGKFNFIRNYISAKLAFVVYCKYRNEKDLFYNIIKKIARKFHLNKLLRISFWKFDYALYKQRYDYDIRLNTEWFKHPLTKQEKHLYEIRYLKYYRLAQAAQGTIWFDIFYNRLKKFSLKTGIGLYTNLSLDHGVIIGHAGTIVMNGNAIFKGNIMITHGVTIGRDIRGRRAGVPTFGHNVVLRTNSVITGNITIGDDVLIAPNTFVNFDVPSHSIVIGNPATIHHRDNATDGHIAVIDE